MGTVRDNERCNDSIEEVDEIQVRSRKRKRRDNAGKMFQAMGRRTLK